MVVKEAVAGADDGLAIALWSPSESDSRRNTVVVAGDALDDAELLFGGGGDGGQTAAEEGNTAEVDVAAKIELEDLLLFGTQLDEVGIRAEFKSVTTVGDGDVVGELEAALDAIDGRVGFTAKITEARDIHGDIGTARQIGEAEMNSAARVLEAKFIEGSVAENGVVLEGDVEIAGR